MKRFLLPVISILVLIPALFSACDVGLGEAVDTERPSVSIEYPSNNVVIKEDFVISGKCADDTSIKSVKVLFQNTSRSEFSFDAVLSEDKNSWSAKINEFDPEKKRYPLADGSYSVTVIATDSAGRTQEDKTSLRIDNTPPLLVLTNPATVLDEKTPLEKAGGFGATIKIQGSVNDFSVTDSDSGSDFVFTVFDKDDNYLGRRELANIPPSLGIIIGEYPEVGGGTTELTESNKFYKMIYGDVGEVVDTKYRKFKVTVSDSARTYKGADVVSDASERGNVSEYYYLYDEIYTDVINNLGIGLPDVYKIITKRAENQSELSESEKNILATLEQFKHDSDDEYEDSAASDSRAAVSRAMKVKPVGTFSLNPLNNPSYEITSFDAFDSSAAKPWEGKSVSTSGNITLLAKVGLSDVPLDDSTFKVVVYKTDEYGKRLESTDEDKNEDVEIPCEWTKNGSNYTGRLTLSSKYVEVAQFYTIELKGQDKSGVEFYNGSKEYKFLVQSGTTPPDVKILSYSAPNSGTTVYLKKKDTSTAVDLVISGTAESRSGSAKGHVTLYPNVNKTDYRENKVVTKSNTETGWTLTIPGSVFNDKKSDAYTVTIYATDEIANQTSKEISVIFDKEDPVVQVNSVNNVVVFDSDTTIKAGGNEFTAKANRGYVNGTITVSGNVSDNDAFASGTWKATCAGKEIAAGKLATSQFKLEIDTTEGTDGQELSIEVEAFDRAGNKCSYSYKYDDGKPLVIHQITDYPVVKLTNANFDIVNDEDIKVGENLFDQTGNNKLSGSVTDDDGIETINVQYAKVSDTSTAKFESLSKNPIKVGGKTSYSLSQELKDSSGKVLEEGSYKIKITATDVNGKTFESQEFALCISNSAPAITFINPLKNTSVYQKKDFVASGTVSGQFKFDGDSSTAILKRGTKQIEVNTDGSWSDIISYDEDLSGNDTPAEGSGITKAAGEVNYTIAYTVTDKFGRSTTDTVQFKTDYTAPIVKVDAAKDIAYIGKTKTTLYSFSGNVTEDNSLKSLEYRIVKVGAGENDTPLVVWTSIPAQKTFNANIDFKDVSGKDVVVQFRATDDAGNVSDVNNASSRTVKIIETAPKFEEVTVTAGDKTFSLLPNESIYYVKESFTVSVTVTSDALDKISGAGKEWTSSSFDIKDISSDGENSYTFTAVDKAGQSASASISVFLDKDSPKLEFSQVSPLVTGYEKTPKEYTNGAVNGTITIQGTASDNDKVVSTVLKIYKAKTDVSNIVADGEAIQSLSFNGTDSKVGDAITITEGVANTANNFKFNVDTTKLAESFDNAGIILRLESTDRAGNTGSTDYPVYVCQETDKPTLSFNNGDVNCTDENEIKLGKNLFGMGNDLLYINVTDDDGVKSVEYTLDGDETSKTLLSDGKSTTFSEQINVAEFKNGVHSLRFKVTDVNGLSESFPESESSSIKVAYDNDVPEISVLKLGDVNYTPDCFAKEKFTLTGNVKDSSGTVTIYLKDGNSETEVAKVTDCATEKDWSYELTNPSGNILRTFVAKDKYGREKSLDIKYKVDTVAPVFNSSYIYLTGETANGSKTYALADSDVKADGVYDPDTVWFTGSSFTIRGVNGTDSKILPVTETNNFDVKLYSGQKTGDKLISTIQPSGNNNFSGSVDVVSETAAASDGAFTIILVATDEAGNESSELRITVHVDKDAPQINKPEIYTENPDENPSAEALKEKGFVNTDKVFVKFEATDTVSKVKTVEIYKTAAMKEKIGSKDFAEPLAEASGVIGINISEYDSKEYDFYINVIDTAGNSAYTDLPNFTFDKVPPVVTYATPAANSDVNKTISIEGTISDLNPPENNSGWDWNLKVKKPGGTSFENVTGATFDTSLETGKFKVSGIDTTKIGEGNAEFIVIATDKAGNTISESDSNAKTLTLKIDQNSDRPVIQLSTISTDGNTTLSSGEISGTISDDDVIKTLEIQMLKKSGASYASLNESAWEEATLNGSNWTFKYSGTDIDGDYKLYFRVTDSAGGVFTSSESEPATAKDKWACPRIQYQGKNEVCWAISFSIDSNPPTIKYFRFATSKDGNSWEEWKDLNNNQLFGGVNYRYAKFRILSYDTVSEQVDLSVSINISEIEKKYTYKKDDSFSAIKLTDVSESIDGKPYYYFESDTIDLNPADKSVPTKSYTIEVEAKDKAEKPKTMSLGIIIDNTAPTTISKINHSSNDELTGDIALSGQVSDDSNANSGIAEMYYAIPYKTVTKPEELADYNKDSESFGTMWFKVDELTSVVWNLTVKTDYIYTKEGSNIVMKDGYIGYQNGSSGIYNLPVWFKIVDNAGNVGYNTGNSVRYNPDADKPRVAITYPVHNVTDSSNNNFSYVIMGGTIRFTGTAEDDEGVQAVYLQFDMDGDGIYENGASVEGCPAEVIPVEIPTSAEKEKGVPVKGTNSWSYSLKVSGLKNLLYSESNKKVLNVRAVALDTGNNDSPLLGAWSEPIHISVNNDVPAFESVKIAQYSGNSSSDTEVKSVEYQDDKYISGTNWYLVGKVSSNAGISEIAVEGAANYTVEIDTSKIDPESGEPVLSGDTDIVLDKTASGGNINEITYKIPVDGTSRWETKITVTDNASEGSKKSNYSNYSLNIDNTPPQFFDIRNNDEKETLGTIKLYKGGYGSSGVILDDKNFVQNSNGFFTLAGRVTEEGSGYENVIFYFKRVPSEKTAQNPARVYNPMESHGDSNRENRADITAETAENGKVYINSDSLPVLHASSVAREDDNEYTLTSEYVKNNKNVRVGGLVKIGGLYRKISAVDYASGKVTFDSACAQVYTEAEFVYGMVIDNSGESLNYDNSIKNDDGDGMVESFAKSGSNYTWDASVDSTNIPDGPIEIHVVVFDKAGNSNHGYVKTSVSNNAPRIARVRLATDLNSNGKYEENETKVFTYLKEDSTDWNKQTASSGTEIWNLDAEGWTIKNSLQVEPEFVGGTAPFYYVFSKESGTGNAKNLTSPKTDSFNASDTGNTGKITANREPFVISNSSLDSSGEFEDKINTYQFSFWDSTEETAPGKDSQWTVLNAQLKQDIEDSNAPKVAVSPFYWNDSDDNSLYGNSLLNGHIELEDDWKNASGYNGSTTGLYDGDPKVSGKIVIRGTAYDDVFLSSLWIKFGKGSGATGQNFTFSNYLTNSGFGSAGRTDDGYVQAAFYENGWQKASAAMETDGWEFDVSDDYFDQNGHKVNWTLSIDTSKLSGIAGTDIDFKVMAVDHVKTAAHKSAEIDSSAVNSDGTTNTADNVYNKPKYRMDVVPYITGLDTLLTDLEVTNPSVYGRSALGKYPVYYYRQTTTGSVNSEKFIVKGFNLSGGTVTFASDSAARGNLGSDYSITIPDGAKSGKISVSVNSIESLNNVNNNEAAGDYNRQLNKQNNNLLTDDVELAIWEINSKAAIAESGELSEVVMHVNPANGMLGFAFAHSQDLASYPNGTASSYQTWITDWTGVNQIGFTFDQNGNMFGTNGGTDTYTPNKKAGRFGLISSKWGTIATSSASNDMYSGYTNYHRLRLEYLGYWGNNSAYASNVYRFAKGDCSQFATVVPSSSKNLTNLYMMYYDNTLGELKFKAGQYDTAASPNLDSFGFSKSGFSFGDFADDAWQTDCRYKNNYNPNYSTISIVSTVAAGSDKNSSAKPGAYYSIAAVPSADGNSDVVVAVWYDAVNKNLWYSYIKNPLATAGKRDSSGKPSAEWAAPVAIFTGNAGESCAIAVDEDKHIHIAAYNRSNAGSLYYAYLDSYDSSFDASKNLVRVDSYGSSGQYITMEVAKDSKGNNIPYIGYWMNSMSYPKYAYLVDTDISNGPKAGTDSNNMYTGAWESVMLPTLSEVMRDDINIGLYKYQSAGNGHLKGEIREIPKLYSSSGTGTEYAGEKNGKAGGNGTANPVLAYGIAETGAGYIETAQLK